MADVARVQKERGLLGKGIDFVHSGLQRTDHIGIGRLVESHVAVTDLHKAELLHFVGLRLRALLRAQSEGFQHASLNHTERARTGPGHTLQKSPAIDAVISMVVLDEAAWVRIEKVLSRHSRFLRFKNVVHHICWQTGDASRYMVRFGSGSRRLPGRVTPA